MNLKLEQINLRRDNVIVRKLNVADVDIAATNAVYGREEVAHAEAESVKGISLLVSSPDIEKTRGEVVAVGPECRNVALGDFVILRDTVGRSSTRLTLEDEGEFILTPEIDRDGDLLCKVAFVNVPVSCLRATI